MLCCFLCVWALLCRCKQKSQTFNLLHAGKSGRKLLQQQSFEEYVNARELTDSSKCSEWMLEAKENSGGESLDSLLLCATDDAVLTPDHME